MDRGVNLFLAKHIPIFCIALINLFIYENVIASDYIIEIRFSLTSESEIIPFVQIVHDDGKVVNIAYQQNNERSNFNSNIEIERSDDYDKMQGVYTITIPSTSSLMYKIWIKNEFSDKIVNSEMGIGSCTVIIKKDNKNIAKISVGLPTENIKKVKYQFAGDTNINIQEVNVKDGVLHLSSIIPSENKIDIDLISLPYPNVVNGYVWNTFNNAPLNSAEIFVDGIRSSITDSIGNYSADLLGMGDHTVYAKYKDKKSKVVNLSIREVFPLEVNFKLHYSFKKQVVVDENYSFEKRYF